MANQVTPSTTNTAALLPCPFCGKEAMDQWPNETLDASGDNCVRCAWCHGAAPMNTWNRRTLTQQQGGEQEAGDGLPVLPYPGLYAQFVGYYTADQMRAYATAALRSKQPAASEGDRRAVVHLDQLSADRDAVQFLESRAFDAAQRTPHVELRWHSHETDGRTGSLWIDGKLSAVTVVLRDDLNRSALVTFDTSKQAAGEAVAWVVANGQGDRWRMWGEAGPEWTDDRDTALHFARRDDAEAFSRDDEDAWLIQPTTPPRHPADEVTRDAERYRFIRGCEENQGPLSVGEFIGVNEHGGEYVAWLYDEELDAAIDAALQAGTP